MTTRRAVLSFFLLLVLVLGVGAEVLREWARQFEGGEAPPIGALRTIATSEALFRERSEKKSYGTLAQLRDAGLVDTVLGSGTKQGYLIEAHPSTATPEFLWWALARPQPGERGRIFFINHAGAQFYKIPADPQDLAVAIDPETAAVPSDFLPIGK